MKINLNEIAVLVAEKEGKKKEVNIAQIKEVMKVFLETISEYTDEEILEVINRYRK